LCIFLPKTTNWGICQRFRTHADVVQSARAASIFDWACCMRGQAQSASGRRAGFTRGQKAYGNAGDGGRAWVRRERGPRRAKGLIRGPNGSLRPRSSGFQGNRPSHDQGQFIFHSMFFSCGRGPWGRRGGVLWDVRTNAGRGGGCRGRTKYSGRVPGHKQRAAHGENRGGPPPKRAAGKKPTKGREGTGGAQPEKKRAGP